VKFLVKKESTCHLKGVFESCVSQQKAKNNSSLPQEM
jgi:hypothetical protein